MKRKKIILLLIFIVLVLLVAIVIIKGQRVTIAISESERLKALQYIAWVKVDNIDKKSVTLHNKTLAYAGYNLYSSENPPGIYLMDMHGKPIHTWEIKSGKLRGGKSLPCYYAIPYGNGDLLAIVLAEGLFKLDWNSNIKWLSKIKCHHDIAVAPNGDIYTLTKKAEFIPYINKTRIIYNDYFTILTSEGKLKKNISIAHLLKRTAKYRRIATKSYTEQTKVLPRLKTYIKTHKINLRFFKKLFRNAWIFLTKPMDVFHTNTISIIDRDIFWEDKKIFKKGDMLICVRDLNLIGVIDINKQQLVWGWGWNDLDYPHHPSLLENGNILIFDNGFHRGYSRIIELNPFTKEIVWEYKTSPPDLFYSQTRGSCQRLPNGNTLITESDRGRAFEITPNETIVWEFHNPFVKEIHKQRAAMYRMIRLFDSEDYPFLQRLKNNLE